MVKELARAGREPAVTKMVAAADATLSSHVESAETATVLGSAPWNVVVLQEQSQVPAVARLREERMYPATRQLVGLIRDVDAEPMVYLTAAHRLGWPGQGLDGYYSMQAAVDEGYLDIAHELGSAVAPVGFAWSIAVSRKLGPDLWQNDGSHPSVRGTYLAACVIYAAVFRRSPIGFRYHADLANGTAEEFQSIASETVLGDSSEWNLSTTFR